MSRATHEPASLDAETPLAGRRAVVVNWRDLEHHLAGGSEIYAWEAARALRSAGAQVAFVTSRDRGQRRRDVVDGIEVRRGGGAFTYYAHAAWQLLRRRHRLDVVIDPECGIPSFSPLWVRRRTPVLLVMHHVHQDQFDTYFPRPLARVGQFLERTVMPRAYRRARVVAVSGSTRDDMRARLGWTGEVEVVPNGAGLPDADRTHRQAPVAAASGTRVLVLGRLVPHKRVDQVVRALAEVRADHPDLHLDIAGKGPEREPLERLVHELGLGDHVTFHGFVTESAKAALIAGATLQVCASDVEGWGQVVLEAAGHGVPTLARDVPGLRESIRDQVTGWLLPEPDGVPLHSGLATGLGLALRDLRLPGREDELARACRAWAAGFSWAAMRARVVELVTEELVTGSAPLGRRDRGRPLLSTTGYAGAVSPPAGDRRPDPVRTHVSGRTER